MPIVQCPMPDCTYATEDMDVAIAAALLMVHNNIHTNTGARTAATINKQRAPKIERPSIGKGSTEEIWNAFLQRWTMFKRGTVLSPDEVVQHLFQCCENELGDDLLKSSPDAVSGTEDTLIQAMKTIAVTPVAVSVRRSELLSMKQDHGESTRSFFARLNGKAATCAYLIDCSDNNCTQKIDFTDTIVKDVLITGLSDDDIKREVLGWADLDDGVCKTQLNTLKLKK